MIENKLVSVKEAAAYCGMSASGFRAWIKRAGIQAKVSGTRRYNLDAIDKAIDALSGITEGQRKASAFSFEYEVSKGANYETRIGKRKRGSKALI